MSELAAEGPNAEMIRYWNEQSGPKWVALTPMLDAQIGPKTAEMMEVGSALLSSIQCRTLTCGSATNQGQW